MGKGNERDRAGRGQPSGRAGRAPGLTPGASRLDQSMAIVGRAHDETVDAEHWSDRCGASAAPRRHGSREHCSRGRGLPGSPAACAVSEPRPNRAIHRGDPRLRDMAGDLFQPSTDAMRRSPWARPALHADRRGHRDGADPHVAALFGYHGHRRRCGLTTRAVRSADRARGGRIDRQSRVHPVSRFTAYPPALWASGHGTALRSGFTRGTGMTRRRIRRRASTRRGRRRRGARHSGQLRRGTSNSPRASESTVAVLVLPSRC